MTLDTFQGIQKNVPLAPYTNLKIGGPATYFYMATDTKKLIELLQFVYQENIPLLLIGGASNMLISKFDGLVIVIATSSFEIEGKRVRSDAGVKLTTLIAKTIDQNLVGLEYLMGILGTLGGAIRGNAGVPGWEIKDFLVEATIMTPQGEILTVPREYLEFGYRTSRIKKEGGTVLSAVLELQEGQKEEARARMKEINETRLKKQPLGKSCGSFFKNPSPDKAAGWLIDQCGLKGFQIGGAKVSEMHGNFLMNTGNATFEDFFQLKELIKEKVFEKFRIRLEEEVHIVN